MRLRIGWKLSSAWRARVFRPRAAVLKHSAGLRRPVPDVSRDGSGEQDAARADMLAKERLLVLTQVTSTVSHELRNPLGVIRSSVFYLQRKLGTDDEKVAKHLARIEQQVATCNAVIDELLEFTRGREPYAVPSDLNAWLQGVVAAITVPDGVRVELELASGLPLVSFDAEKMQRVVENLLENALQSLAVRVEAEGPLDARVTATTGRRDAGVFLAVRDTGAGLTDEALRRAFEPLFTTRARGTGLGLAIARKIADQHGALLTLERNTGPGATATLVLRAAPPESKEAGQ